MRDFVADAIAPVPFFTITHVVIERFLAGMDRSEHGPWRSARR
jgi:hypothetical protein